MKRKAKQPELFERKLFNTLAMLSHCQKEVGKEQECYCMIGNGQAVAFNGIVAIGQAVDEHLQACPHTKLMTAALARCSEQYAITVEPERLTVRSGEFIASVPCCDASRLVWAIPDASMCSVTDTLAAAIKIVADLANDKAPTVLQASIQLNSGTVLATDRSAIIEAWHGHSLPNGILLPKLAATTLKKIKKTLVGFGYSPASATFWFEDNSWMKTQLYEDKWPSVADIFKAEVEYIDLPKEKLIEAVNKVAPFSKDGFIYFGSDKVFSSFENKGAEYASISEDMPSMRVYRDSDLFLMCKLATKIDYATAKNATFFVGNNLRGAVAHRIWTGIQDDGEIPF